MGNEGQFLACTLVSIPATSLRAGGFFVALPRLAEIVEISTDPTPPLAVFSFSASSVALENLAPALSVMFITRIGTHRSEH